jgi:hypothetical protein
MAWLRAMLRGTMVSIRRWRVRAAPPPPPITDSMCCSSAAVGPMWRAQKAAAFSRSDKGFKAGVGMVAVNRAEGRR